MKTLFSQFLIAAILLLASSGIAMKRASLEAQGPLLSAPVFEVLEQVEAETPECLLVQSHIRSSLMGPEQVPRTTLVPKPIDVDSSLNQLYLAHAPPALT